MNGSISEMIIIGISVLVVVLLIVGVFVYVNMSKQQNNQSTEALAGVMASYDDPEKLAYDGATVMGSEVQDLIGKVQRGTSGWENITIVVKTKSNKVYSYVKTGVTPNTDFSPIAGLAATPITPTAGTDPSTDVNPSASYKCTVDRNGDDVIVSLSFTQSQ